MDETKICNRHWTVVTRTGDVYFVFKNYCSSRFHFPRGVTLSDFEKVLGTLRDSVLVSTPTSSVSSVTRSWECCDVNSIHLLCDHSETTRSTTSLVTFVLKLYVSLRQYHTGKNGREEGWEELQSWKDGDVVTDTLE